MAGPFLTKIMNDIRNKWKEEDPEDWAKRQDELRENQKKVSEEYRKNWIRRNQESGNV